MTAPSLEIKALLRIAILAALLGCGDDSQPTGLHGGETTVRGTVASARTAVGVPNLIVALVSDGAVLAAAPTDAQGRFAFERVPSGSYMVHVTGLELSALSARHTVFEPAATQVAVGGTPLDLLFAAVGVIPPRIVGDIRCNGAVVDAQVRIVGGETDIVVATNAQGRYAATDLAPGNYAVIVTEAPCTITPAYRVASLLPAQAAQVDFDG